MKSFAFIENGIVVSTVVGNSLEEVQSITDYEVIEYSSFTPAIIGLGYNGVSFEIPPTYIWPVPEDAINPNPSDPID